MGLPSILQMFPQSEWNCCRPRGGLTDQTTSLRYASADIRFSHAATVNRLAWRPISDATNHLQLASCADDRSVRIFDISP